MISILLPVYNAAPYLPACLDSILAQSESNWELLAVDDFSQDESWAILQKYARRETRLKIFRNTEKGLIPALRLAFAQSSGKWITRMDADDLMPPDKLKLLLGKLKEKGEGYLATGFVEYISDKALGEGYRRYAAWLNGLVLNNRRREEIYRECVIPSPCWMVHRKDLIRAGAFYPDIYPEDYDLCFRFFQQGLKATTVPEVLHYWRDHPGRASRNDPNYQDNRFFELKLKYFLQLDRQADRPLALWGGGGKGKTLARLLIARQICFHWVCGNPKKWNLDVYGVRMQSFEKVPSFKNPQLILAVSSPDGQEEIREYLKKWQFKAGINYFWFC